MQGLLAKQVRALNEAMGIGTSGNFYTDGEFIVFDLLRKHSQPPYCIFDVGANKGQFLTCIQNSLEKEEYMIHCFEPSLQTFRMLEKNVRADARVRLNNLGLGKENCETELYYGEAGDEGASLTKRNLAHYGINFDRSETIHLTTLDDYCRSHGIGHIHLLKLDIEGHELDALSGARNMITERRIDIILFEFGGCNIDTCRFFRDYWHFFENTPMEIFRTTPSGYLVRIEKYREELEQFCYSNFVAIQKLAK